MPTPTPFHERTFPLCETWRFRDWAGRIAVCAYDINIEREYWAIRQAAGLIDVSPLYKYDLAGPDAGAVLSRLAVRDIGRLAVGRVAYCCWCDDSGMVIDDGTITRLTDDHYRVTAAEPALDWLLKIAGNDRVEIQDRSRDLAVLALQGPRSRRVLAEALETDIDALKYFAAQPFSDRRLEGWITRTGYTGDLGYEIWVQGDQAIALWDRVIESGGRHDLQPVGLDALDVCRIEAGYLLHGIDYYSAHEEHRLQQLSTPFELGWSWMVHLDRDPFVGREALRAAATSPRLNLVGLTLDFAAITDLYSDYERPPHLPASASRDPLPVFARSGRQVGQVTSSCWSPVLKRPLALASVEPGFASNGSLLEVEHTVDYDRRRVPAVVDTLPFYDPPWRRA